MELQRLRKDYDHKTFNIKNEKYPPLKQPYFCLPFCLRLFRLTNYLSRIDWSQPITYRAMYA